MVKIEGVRIREFMGLEALDMVLNAPLNIISGMNEAGKSGLRDAIYWAFTGEARGLKTHKEQAALIKGFPHDMAKAAEVDIIYTGGQFSRRKTPKTAATVMGEIPDLGLSPAVLFDPYVFLSLTDSQRREMMFEVIPGLQPTKEEVFDRLIRKASEDRKVSLEMVATISELAEEAAGPGSFRSAELQAIELRREAKRDLAAKELEAMRPENWYEAGPEDAVDLGMVNRDDVVALIAEVQASRDDLVKRKGRQEDAQEVIRKRCLELQDQISNLEAGLETPPAEDYIRLLQQDQEAAMQAEAELIQAGGAL